MEIDKHYYSVPWSLLGQQLEACISGELVRLFKQGQEVAVHPRKRTYGYSTRNEHMPEAHRQHTRRFRNASLDLHQRALQQGLASHFVYGYGIGG
ncbi:hypothetical protein O5853_29240, partial [Escherichia coli]|nr:hypothetical protein [Escherichia coli]